MPKVHNIGSHRFIQFIKFPVMWEGKLAVKGWTQEIEEPFRSATPIIVRLPFHNAIVFGRWTATHTEEEALNKAVQRRDLSDDDFQEERGWTPVQDSEASSEDTYS
jgi:hypothetical protein